MKAMEMQKQLQGKEMLNSAYHTKNIIVHEEAKGNNKWKEESILSDVLEYQRVTDFTPLRRNKEMYQTRYVQIAEKKEEMMKQEGRSILNRKNQCHEQG